MTTVKEAIRMLNDTLDQDEEICIAWWAKELFEGAFNTDIKEEVWGKVVSEFDDMTIYPQELIYNQIVQIIDDNKGWIDNE